MRFLKKRASDIQAGEILMLAIDSGRVRARVTSNTLTTMAETVNLEDETGREPECHRLHLNLQHPCRLPDWPLRCSTSRWTIWCPPGEELEIFES